jgi:hypothetical protein
VVTDLAQLFQVGTAGLIQLANRGEAALPYLDGIDLKNYEHDLRVTEARILLEELGARGWHSERQLHQRGHRGRLPDALFALGQNRCMLELELSLKRLDRYPAIFRGYGQARDPVGAVFYLCGSRATGTPCPHRWRRAALLLRPLVGVRGGAGECCLRQSARPRVGCEARMRRAAQQPSCSVR